MKKKVTLRISYFKSQLNLMNETLELLTADLSITILEKTRFLIEYNPRGGYYNLNILCDSKKNAQVIKELHDSYTVERVFKS